MAVVGSMCVLCDGLVSWGVLGTLVDQPDTCNQQQFRIKFITPIMCGQVVRV